MAYSKIKRSDLTFGDELGRGGFSTVYQATWRQSQQTGNEVAAKKLNKAATNELEIMSKLNHSNIVKFFGVVDEKPDFFLILELCKGGSLREYLDKHPGKRLPPKQFFDWAKQVTEPLEYLRKMGIVHKDVKSQNYMIADANVLKLADFGLAKALGITMSNATGSASYPWVAPELLKDLKLSPSYDIYALAVVLWELWTKAMPFKGLEPQVIAWKVCHDNERPPIPADCPKPLADLMRQCWEVDWHKRPSIDDVLSVITATAAAAKAAKAAEAAEAAAKAAKAAAKAAEEKAAAAMAAAAKAAAAKAAAAKAVRQRAIINGPWELEMKVNIIGPGQLWPCGIAVNPNGDIAVTDHLVDKVQVYSSEGANKLSLNTKEGLIPGTMSNPQEVTVSPEGEYYYVTDKTQYVKVYDVNGSYKRKWVAVSPQHKPSDTEYTKLIGLTIDVKNQLLVGETKQKYISKHRLDGSHIASIKVGIEPKSLAVTSQDAVIINDWEGSVHIVDNAGQLMHTIKPPTDAQEWRPKGNACIEDIICICDHWSKGICCFSVSGEYLGSIPIEIPGEPRCLAFTVDGNKLLVTFGAELTDDGVVVYKLQR